MINDPFESYEPAGISFAGRQDAPSEANWFQAYRNPQVRQFLQEYRFSSAEAAMESFHTLNERVGDGRDYVRLPQDGRMTLDERRAIYRRLGAPENPDDYQLELPVVVHLKNAVFRGHRHTDRRRGKAAELLLVSRDLPSIGWVFLDALDEAGQARLNVDFRVAGLKCLGVQVGQDEAWLRPKWEIELDIVFLSVPASTTRTAVPSGHAGKRESASASASSLA